MLQAIGNIEISIDVRKEIIILYSIGADHTALRKERNFLRNVLPPRVNLCHPRLFISPLNIKKYTTDMKKISAALLGLFMCTGMVAQDISGYTNRTTVYETYQPARITLTTGNVIFKKQANIFLKNGRLLFKDGKHDMEANMIQIKAVDFKDRSYVRIDTILATVIDTVGTNRLLCTTTIDLEAFATQKINDRLITNIRMGDQVSATSMEAPDEDNVYPLVNRFYYEIDGKIVEVHERVLRRMLPKKERDRLEFYQQQPNFKWSDTKSLLQVLELFKK